MPPLHRQRNARPGAEQPASRHPGERPRGHLGLPASLPQSPRQAERDARALPERQREEDCADGGPAQEKGPIIANRVARFCVNLVTSDQKLPAVAKSGNTVPLKVFRSQRQKCLFGCIYNINCDFIKQ